MMQTRSRVAGAVLLLALLTGCGTSTTELSLQPRAAPAPAATRSSAGDSAAVLAVPVFILAVQDQRLDPESLGHAGRRPFAAKGVPEWIDAALRTTIGKRLPVAADAAHADLVIQPTLHKCYVSNVDVTKAAVIVVDVAYLHQSKEAGHRVYRGRHTSMNWWNSDAEFQGALQTAFDDCVAQILADVEARAKLIAMQKRS